MKPLFLSIVISLISQLSIGQTDSGKVQFVAWWAVGDRYDYAVSKVNRDWMNDLLVVEDSITYTVSFTVLDSTPDSYKVRYLATYDFVETIEDRITQVLRDEKSLRDLVEMEAAKEIIYETDPFGVFKKVLNEEAIISSVQALYDKLVQASGEISADLQESYLSYRKSILDAFLDIENMEHAGMNTLNLFHFPYKLEMEMEQKYESNRLMSNVLGGRPVRVKEVLSIVEIDPEGAYCTFERDTQIAPDEIERLGRELVSSLGLDIEDSQWEGVHVQVEGMEYFQYYFNPGIPVFVYSGRKNEMEIDGNRMKQVNETYIEIILEE